MIYIKQASMQVIQGFAVRLGFWRIQDIPAGETDRLLNTALDAGINTIDEAYIYGNYNSQKEEPLKPTNHYAKSLK